MKIDSPASQRNCGPIRDVLGRYLPSSGFVLELASGGGFHVASWAQAFAGLTFQPSDIRSEAFESIREWIDELALDNVALPIELDARQHPWPVARADAVIAVNMAHISPWDCTLGLLAGAAHVLDEEGLLFVYGPFNVGGQYTSSGNREFDASLRARDPSWGIRDMEQVVAQAEAQGLALIEKVSMPANNLMLVFRC